MVEDEVPFADGNISSIVRVGGTVRRKPGSWTPAVHALLRHLEVVGFDGAPRALGFDNQGREVLSYIGGETGPASLAGIRSDETLVAVAQLVRRFHDAVADFKPPADAEWQFTVGAPRTGEIVCHNDLAPWNAVFAGGQPVALIDWDFAAPAPRLWDVAYALWRFVPLYPDDTFGPPAERARRLTLFCDSYGLADRGGLIDTIARRQQVLCETTDAWGRASVPGFAELWRDGHGDLSRADLAYLQRHRDEIRRLVERTK